MFVDLECACSTGGSLLDDRCVVQNRSDESARSEEGR